METDYISREAAIELLEVAIDDSWEPSYAAERMCEIHAADVRPVVLCRDCRYFRPMEMFINSPQWDGMCRYWNSHATRLDGWCFCGADMRTIGQRLNDISVEEDLFPELTAEEKAENKAEAKRMIGGTP